MDAERAPTRSRLPIVILVVAALLVAGFVALQLIGDGDDEPRVASAGSTTSTSAASSSTSGSSTTTFAPTADPAPAVFPDVLASRRFDDPEAAAFAFVTEVLRFQDPVVGDFAQGDSRSGEIEVRAFAAQPTATTVLVRQLEDDTWFVIGAVADTIRLDTPAQGATIASPQPLGGAASAFEGTVDVRLFVDGVTEPIATTFVTGSGDGTMGDFSGELEFVAPDGAEHGILVLSEEGPDDGTTVAATVIRVHF